MLNRLLDISVYGFRRIVAFNIDFFLCIFIFLLYKYIFYAVAFGDSLKHPSIMDQFIGLFNVITIGVFQQYIDVFNFAVHLFTEHVNSLQLFWTQFKQLLSMLFYDVIWSTLVDLFHVYSGYFLYKIVMECSTLKGTVGKKLVGLKVVNLIDGKQISLSASIIRNLMLLFTLPFFDIAILPILFTKKRQAIHDIVSNTAVE